MTMTMTMTTRSTSTMAGKNPYVGPRAFTRGETIYGRDRELQRLVHLLIAERIVVLFSPSGAGKTSLIQAGLVPRLEQEAFVVLPAVRVGLEPPAFACDAGSLRSFAQRHYPEPSAGPSGCAARGSRICSIPRDAALAVPGGA